MASDYRRFLDAGERVVWEGRPATGFLWRPIEIFLIPFSLLWGGFALFWNVMAWTSIGDDLFFRLWGLPFLIVGLYAIFGRFLVDSWLRGRMRYLVTDHRVLIVKGDGRSSKSLDIKRLPMLELQEGSDGSGSIRFGQAASMFSNQNFGIWSPALEATPQFLKIEHVRTVYDLIRRQAG